LGFPCNQFGRQEAGTNQEIKEFATTKYNVTFPMFSKIDVNGSNAHPLYIFLRSKLSGILGSSVKWNFTKFLVNRSGVPVKRFGPPELPLDFESDIQQLLNQSSALQ
jgi:glutathione peroxidase